MQHIIFAHFVSLQSKWPSVCSTICDSGRGVTEAKWRVRVGINCM